MNNMGLFLREADVHITSKIQTPMERLLKIAAKPSQTTMKLASRVLTTREEILDLSKKFGIYAPNGVETGTPRIKFRNIILSFRRNLKHKVRFYWRPIVFHYLIIIGLSFILTSAFNENIGVPDSCFNQTSNTTIGRLVITETDTLIADFNEQIVTLYGQNLVEENLKFMFVISICLALFQMIISVNGLNEEVKVAINEHRNGQFLTHSEGLTVFSNLYHSFRLDSYNFIFHCQERNGSSGAVDEHFDLLCNQLLYDRSAVNRMEISTISLFTNVGRVLCPITWLCNRCNRSIQQQLHQCTTSGLLLHNGSLLRLSSSDCRD